MKKIPIKEFLRPLLAITKELPFIFLYVLLSTWFAWYTTYILKPMSEALVNKEWLLFSYYTWSIWIFGLVVIIYFFSVRKVFLRWDNKFEQYLNKKVLTKFIHLDNTYIESQGTWRLIDIIRQWINTWINLLWILTLSMMMSLFFTIWSLTNVYLLSPILFLVFLIGLSLFVFLVVLFNKKIIHYRTIAKEIWVEYSRNLVKIISSKFEILQSKKINSELDWLASLLNKYWDNHAYIQTYIELMFATLRFFILVLRLSTFWYVWYLTYQGQMNPSSLITLVTAIWIIDITLMFFIENYKTFVKEIIHVQKLWNTIECGPEIEWYFTGNKFEFKKWNIELKDITFEYDWKKVLENFNLSIEWWKKTALIGKSWVWKTTLVKLISWFVRPKWWQVIIDWQDLKDTSLESFYSQIWYFTQESSLFDWTIRENLLYSITNTVSEDEIKDALLKAKCEFVFNFKNWLDTEIWERGIMLSGWQKQRITLAKVFLKNPKILILDEPTSALDSFSESEITKAIHNLMEWRTIIIIAHRLQTIKECDMIYVLWQNKVLESWTHSELIKKWKEYKQMVNLQSGVISE